MGRKKISRAEVAEARYSMVYIGRGVYYQLSSLSLGPFLVWRLRFDDEARILTLPSVALFP